MDFHRYFDFSWAITGAGMGLGMVGVKMAATGFPYVPAEDLWKLWLMGPAIGFFLCGIGAVIMRPINKAGDRWAERLAKLILRGLAPILALIYPEAARRKARASAPREVHPDSLDWD